MLRAVERKSSEPAFAQRRVSGGQQLARLTSLRAAAALFVFGYHASPPSPIDHVTQFGYTGVAFFFLLSGFVITWGNSGERGRRSFYVRRLARIYPSHFVTWTVALTAKYTVVALSVSGVVAPLFLVQAWFPTERVIFGANGVSWSLSCEIAFYAAVPFVLPRLRVLDSVLRWRIGVGYATLAAALVIIGTRVEGWHIVAYTNPALRFGEFLLGCVAAIALSEGWRLQWRLAGALLLLGAALLVVGPRALPGPDVAATAIYFVVVVMAAQRDLDQPTGWLTMRPFVYAGQLSFAFYLVHQLVGLNVFLGWASLRGVTRILVQFVIAVVAAAVLHHLIERPCERWIRTRFADRTPLPVDT